jgi:AsmA protein
MRRLLRWLAGGAVLAAALVVAAGLAAYTALHRGSLDTLIDAALERATGRAITVGAVALRPALRPTVNVEGARIASLPGTSHADFARIGRLEVTLALWPLLSAGRVEVERLSIAEADILLERDAEGRGNWVFDAEAPAAPQAERTPRGLPVAALSIANSRIAWGEGPLESLRIGAFDVQRAAPNGATSAQGRVVLGEEALQLAFTLGPPTDAAPALHATLSGPWLRLTAQGTRALRWREDGLSVAVEGRVEQPERLARLLGVASLPLPFGPVDLAARVASVPAGGTEVSDLRLRTGALDLGRVLSGLRADTAELRAATLEAPAMLTAAGRRGGAPLTLEATLASPRRLVAEAGSVALPVQATLRAGRARLTLSGPLAVGARARGTALDAALAAPDLAALGPLVGASLPALRDVTAQARILAGGPGPLRLQRLAVTSDRLEAEGELQIATAPVLSITGRIAARRFDADALAGPAQGGAAPDAGRVIPDVPLPLAALAGWNANLTLSAERLVAGGLTWRSVRAGFVLADGRLTLDPLAASMPGGALSGRATLGPAGTTLALRSAGRGLDFAALRAALGDVAIYEGPVEVALDLRGQGGTTRALAASLSGDLGLAMVEGRMARGNLQRIGPDLVRVLLPAGAPPAGLNIRCAALRLTAREGLAQSEALLMEGPGGRIDGSLAINLRDETLVARLLPDINILGVGVRTPVAIGGTLAAPAVGVEPGAALAQVMSDAVANRLWRSSTVEWLRGASGAPPPGGDCGTQLRLARLGRDGPVPPAPPPVMPLVPRELQGTVQEVARGVGGTLGAVVGGVGSGIGGLLGLGRR